MVAPVDRIVFVNVHRVTMDLTVKIPSVAQIVSMEIVQVQIHVPVIVDGMDQHVLRVIYIH
jgi:hypothetical protein